MKTTGIKTRKMKTRQIENQIDGKLDRQKTRKIEN